MRKPLYLAVAALLGSLGAHAAHAETVRVRLDDSDRVALDVLQVRPVRSTEYAGFRVLELSAADAERLLQTSTAASLISDAGRIHFNHIDFDPLRTAVPASKSTFSTAADGRGLHLVQFNAPIKQGWRSELEQSGLRVLQYYPNDTFLVWGNPATSAEALGQPHVRWQGAFLPDYKVNRDLVGRSGRISNVDVHFYNDGDVSGLIEQLKQFGANVLSHAPAQPDRTFMDAWIQVDAEQLQAIAQLPQVVWLGYASPRGYFEDEMSDQILAGNYNGANQPQLGYAPWLTGFGYDGTGVIMGVVDSGVDLGHPDLQPRISGGYTFPGCSSPAGGDDNSSGGHGTHVAGIIAGQGVGDGPGGAVSEVDANGFLYGLGVARGASIYAMASVDCGAPWPPAPGWQELSKRGIAGNAIGTNASWTTGEGAAHGYQASERTFDFMIRDGDFDAPGNQPFIFAFSAGNSGPGASTLTAPKEAKNPIVSASSRNFRAGAITDISGFSSRGPAVDGRVLPNIASPGESIASTRRRAGGAACVTAITGTSNHYALCSGTSMASPHTAGAAAIITQWWKSTHAGAVQSPAMTKALLVNGAIDLGTADVPNNNEGWGRVNLPNSILGSGQRHLVDQTALLDNAGETYQLTLGIPDTGKPVRVTLAWTDAPGAVGANPALVNNLDLEVLHNATTYRGNVMTAGQSASGGSADTRNNVENVFLPAGTSGAVTVTIRASNLPGDGVPGSGDATDQDFALICDNCSLTPGYTLAPSPSSQSVCAPADASYDVAVGSILGYGDTVNLSTANVPAGASAMVVPASLAPGNTAVVTLTGTGNLSPGSHGFNIEASSTSGSQSLPLSLNLYDAAPAAGVLLAPANAATGTATLPTLQWNPVAQAASYTVEVATDANFNNIVFTQTVSATQVTLPTALAANTEHHWRVRASNTCGTGVDSPAFIFTTANLICILPNLGVPDNTPAGVNSNLVIGQSGSILDLDLTLKMTHTYPGDLNVTLTHVASNTTVTIGSRLGGSGCGIDNIDAVFNDGSPTAMSCRTSSPGIGGNIRPSNPLAAFNGLDLASTWRLNIADVANQDTGVLQEWCLTPALPSGPADSMFGNGFE